MRAEQPITPLRLFASRERSGAYVARLLVGNPAALGVGMEQAGMKPVESGNAGVGLVRREQHRPSVGPALEHGAHERRQRDAAMPIDSA